MRANVHLLRLAALTTFAGLAAAQVPAVSSFTGATFFGGVDGSNQTIGFTFTANSDLVVSALGVWEDPANGSNPLAANHQVGLWTSGGTLLASATVLTNSPFNGAWRYVPITPVTLTAGQGYIVGNAITVPLNDTHARVNLPGGTVTTSPLITIGLATVNASAGGFSVPNITNPAALARLGPNLIVQAAPPTPTAVPISSWTLGIIGMGLALMAALVMGMRYPASGSAL